MNPSKINELTRSVLSIARKTLVALVIFIAAGTAQTALAQNGTIKVTGKVTCGGEGVIGASVMVKGTSTGTVTDIDGAYGIQVRPDVTLVISAIGYSSEEVNVDGRTVIDIKLTEEALNLADAVVVGYGVQKKVNLTGAVSSVSTEDLKGKPVANVLEGLQGTTPGLVIQQGSSTPGGSPTLNIRGYNTMNNNDPLVIIDGIEG